MKSLEEQFNGWAVAGKNYKKLGSPKETAIAFARHAIEKALQEAAELPQPLKIESLLKERFEERKLYDEDGWTGEWRLSVKDVLDIILDL